MIPRMHHALASTRRQALLRQPSRAARAVLLAVVLAAILSACGSAKPAAPPKHAAAYPPNFAASFSTHCRQTGTAADVCRCALPWLENNVSYSSIRTGVATIQSGADVSWFDQLQLSCRRNGSAYLAPSALSYLAAPVAHHPRPKLRIVITPKSTAPKAVTG